MAVLKCMHARNGNVEYHTNLDRISVVDRWCVNDTDRLDPWGAFRMTGDYAIPNVICTSSFDYESDDDRDDNESGMALLVVCEREGRAPFGVVCEQSSTYLMGDDGGTIDRL